MAVLLQIRSADKRYGEQVLLDDAEASIVEGTKVGFVGRNGAGKSTLLRVLLGEEELERGEVIAHPNLKIGYLRQHDPFIDGESALDFLMRDSGKPDWKCGEVAGQFELKGDYLNGPVSSLSGGWQTRVKLAALLLHEPNLLLLDEPTNFLDVRTQILLEHFLRSYNKGALIVSHDRAFLQATCDHTLDLSRGKLTMYPGKIEQFLEYQAERREHDERVNASVQAKQKHLQKFIDKNRAKASKATQAKSKGKQLARLKTVEIESEMPTAAIRAPIVQPRQGPAVRLEEVVIGYPEHTVASNIDLEIEHGGRTAIVGDNGQGKTTLLRTIVGSLEPRGGNLRWGHHCNIGVYAQHVYGALDESQTVLEYLEYQALPETTTQQILTVAGSLLFRDSAVEKRIKVLSGGERARLCMAGLLLGDYNILVLDEPGNHLDVETIDSLAEALIAYDGTVIFTSHDRYFMRRLATEVIEVRSGRVRKYQGDYEAYLYYIEKEIDEGERSTASKSVTRKSDSATTDSNSAGPASYASNKESRKIRKEIKSLERSIEKLDTQRKEHNDELMNCTDPDRALELHNSIEQIRSELELAEARWLQLSEQAV
ncbi:MAG TPA: ABC transporter ATP-binding protein [Planctomycetaceae bacterium]|nr:ABC transporter ATP-binding protein [Planctomycetaceae bacterium]